MKVAVIGANGQLGSDICKVYRQAGDNAHELCHDQIDIAFPSCFAVIKNIKPDLLINTASMHQVESCEEDPQKSFLVNGLGARNLAIISKKLKLPLVHISTDYVFDGLKRSPYIESDMPSPLNVYGNTKLSGEIFIMNTTELFFIVRVSGLFGHSPCRAKGGLNFVRLMLKLAKEHNEVRVVDDEILSPTYTFDIAKQLEKLTRTEKYGLYHMASKGSCSWYVFADKIFELTKTVVNLKRASPGEFQSKVPRPKYSVLKNAHLAAEGLDIMPHWVDGLKRYLAAAHQG